MRKNLARTRLAATVAALIFPVVACQQSTSGEGAEGGRAADEHARDAVGAAQDVDKAIGDALEGAAETETTPATPASRAEEAALPPPSVLCGALSGVDLGTGPWNCDGTDCFCSSDYREIGPPAPGSTATNLAFYVIGESADRVHTAKLVLNVNNPATRAEGLSRLADAAQVLAAKADLALLPHVVAAAQRGEPLRETAGPVTYEIEKEQTRIETFSLLVLDTGAAEGKTRARDAAIRSSADLFSACKRAIAQDLSYPAASLAGDGEPLQHSGYQSFMVSGRNRDVFFCEAYPDGTYKIKAAFAGNYPFKYVTEGAF